jgi:arsenate reductase-like glutaredoxin family protein
VDARKAPIRGREALGVIEEVDEIYAVKGKKVIHLDLRTARPDEQALLEVLLGPTGNLRAPALRRGRTLIVGFDEPTYERLLR